MEYIRVCIGTICRNEESRIRYIVPPSPQNNARGNNCEKSFETYVRFLGRLVRALNTMKVSWIILGGKNLWLWHLSDFETIEHFPGNTSGDFHSCQYACSAKEAYRFVAGNIYESYLCYLRRTCKGTRHLCARTGLAHRPVRKMNSSLPPLYSTLSKTAYRTILRIMLSRSFAEYLEE